MGLYLLDTNVLLRLVQTASAQHSLIRDATEKLWARGDDLCYTSQNLAEFWNVCTRPAEHNGFGFSIERTDSLAGLIESWFELLPDSLQVHEAWRRIVVEYQVSGVQVHDARLVAAMQVHRIQDLLTMNSGDFRRYAGIFIHQPEDVLKG